MAATVPSPIALEPPDATALHTLGGLITDLRRGIVAVADQLGSTWDTIEYLYPLRLKITAAPDIDECIMSYDYGPMMRENDSTDAPDLTPLQQYPPLDLIGKYCRVTIPQAGIDDVDIVWYGIIETDAREPMGDQPDSEPRGRQQFQALGLLRLLELTTVVKSVVNNNPPPAWPGPQSEKISIGHGLQFNGAAKVEYDDRGNLAQLTDTVDGEPIFSGRSQGGQLWTAGECVQYLIRNNRPVDASGTDICDWQMSSDYNPSMLDWYDVTARTDLKNVKAVLDELISRKRGVSYFVTYTEPPTSLSDSYRGLCTLSVFNFVDTPIPLPSVTAIPANPNQVSLDFENAFDVEATLTNSVAQQYDTVVVMGAFRTTTCTMLFSGDNIVPDWSTEDEDDYKTAASGDADYGTLENREKCERNSKYRKTDKLKHVYSRYRIAQTFPGYISSPDGNRYALAPKLIDSGDGTDLDGSMLFDGRWYDSMTAGVDTEPLWNRGLIIEQKLPFKDRGDYSETKIKDGTSNPTDATTDDDGQPNWEYIKPFVFMLTVTVGGDQKYGLLDQLAGEPLTDSDFCRCPWSVSARILNNRPALELKVSGAPQHAISPTSFAGAAGKTSQHEDPATRSMCAKDYTSFIATLTIRLPHRVIISRSVGDRSIERPGKIERVLYIELPDARLDYVIPGTYVLIKNGLRVQSTSGGNVRDDRDRMRAIAEAAAAWYGRPRQTIELTVKQIREVVKLGWLITDVGPSYSLSGVNTPITGITYDFANGTTQFQTAFADLEFQVEGQ